MFRKLTQTGEETVGQYVARLQKAADGCDFANVETESVDQVVTGCYSNDLRSKLLDKGSKLELKRLLEMVAHLEAASLQSREMRASHSSNVQRTSQVNKVKCFSSQASVLVGSSAQT